MLLLTHQCCFYAMQMLQIISIRVSLRFGYQGRYFWARASGHIRDFHILEITEKLEYQLICITITG